MTSPSTSTSIGCAPVDETTVPPLIRMVTSRLRQRAVALGSAVPVEGPARADLVDQAQVEVPDDQLCLLVRRRAVDELAPGVGEVGGAVEVVVAEVLDADPVEGADEVHVGRRR